MVLSGCVICGKKIWRRRRGLWRAPRGERLIWGETFLDGVFDAGGNHATLVELVGLVNFAVIFLYHTTLDRLLTCLLKSLDLMLLAAPFGHFFCFLP